MSLFEFKENDVYVSTIKSYPENKFFFYDGKKYYNNNPVISGNLTDVVGNIPSGYISLYELNVDRNPDLHTYNADTDSGQKHLIYPFVNKSNNSYQNTFKNISGSTFFSKKVSLNGLGEKVLPIITGSYPLSSSIEFDYYLENSTRPKIDALKNLMLKYEKYSRHFEFSSSLHNRNLSTEELMLINVPKIFYGNKIKKGSVDLKFFVSGSLIAHLNDSKNNGELVQINPSGSLTSGSVHGIVLYNEGLLLLTGSNSLLDSHTEDYRPDGTGSPINPAWRYFGVNCLTSSQSIPSSSFSLDFKGEEKLPVLNMSLHARKGELNFSNNLTFIESGSIMSAFSSSVEFKEEVKRKKKNIVSSSWVESTGSYENRTFISTFKIYDEDKNVIAIGKLAKPVLKKPDREFTIKTKVDL